ncbi:MAG: SPL family radical SAM protein [Nitrospirota bacterium]
MSLIIKEVHAKSVLSKSGIPGADYCLNPYTGCSHACRYCYATFMKKYTNHPEPWGTFVDVKVNAPEVLKKQLGRARKGTVMVSSVTDAYQPVEATYRLTRQCLGVLLEHQFPVSILTKSPLVVRDADLLAQFEDVDVGLTITTDDERMRKIFEPYASPITERVKALRELHEKGIRTYVFIGPLLPMDPDVLVDLIRPSAEYVYISRMNYYSKTAHLFDRLKLRQWLDKGFTGTIVERLKKGFGKQASLC